MLLVFIEVCSCRRHGCGGHSSDGVHPDATLVATRDLVVLSNNASLNSRQILYVKYSSGSERVALCSVTTIRPLQNVLGKTFVIVLLCHSSKCRVPSLLCVQGRLHAEVG